MKASERLHLREAVKLKTMFRGKDVRDSWPSYCQFTGVSKKGIRCWYFALITLVIGLSASAGSHSKVIDESPRNEEISVH